MPMTRASRAFALLLVAILALPSVVQAEQAGPLKIEQAWARSSIGEQTSSAAYFKITNSSDAADRLLEVATEVAGHTMLHESRMKDGVMTMAHIDGGIAVPAHGSAELKPAGLHVMLMGLKRPLKEGETFPMTLRFEKQGEVPVTVTVAKQAPAP